MKSASNGAPAWDRASHRSRTNERKDEIHGRAVHLLRQIRSPIRPWIIRWRWLVLFAALLFTMALGYVGQNLWINTNYRAFFSEDNPQLTAESRQIPHAFRKDDYAHFLLTRYFEWVVRHFPPGFSQTPRPKDASAQPIRLRANTITAVQLSLHPTSGRLRAGESTSARPLTRSGTPLEIPLQQTPTPADT